MAPLPPGRPLKLKRYSSILLTLLAGIVLQGGLAPSIDAGAIGFGSEDSSPERVPSQPVCLVGSGDSLAPVPLLGGGPDRPVASPHEALANGARTQPDPGLALLRRPLPAPRPLYLTTLRLRI
jgi:hypothetical protein